jgi:predicted dehydrogenase
MAEKIRLGIIGVGQIGKHHVENYLKIDDAEIVAVADINETEAQRVAQLHGIPNVTTDFRELLARDDIDAVDVALHNNLHMPVTVAALEAGKHVYCEKPMAGAYVDAEKMLRVAREQNRKLSIQLFSLFANETKAAKIVIERGLLGNIYHVRSTGFRRRGRPFIDGYGTKFFTQKAHASGGALYDMGIYHIARMLYLIGNPELETITGNVYQETAMDAERQAVSGYDVEELAVGYARLAGGLSFDIIESWAIHLNKFEGSSIAGSQGGIRLDPFGYYHNVGDLELDSTVNLDDFNYRVHLMRDDADAYDSPQQHWIAGLQGRVDLLPTAEIALNTMLISEGLYLSHQLGREVTADEVKHWSKSTAATL